jgi:GTP-binding protein YchF
MGVKCGMVGLPNCGKSTIFNALTRAGAEAANFPFSTVTPNVGVVAVPDARLERIHALVETERVVPAELEVVDIAGLPKGASRGEGLGNKFLGHIKETDALLHVVRCFESATVVREGPVDPVADVEVCETELALADLETVERNLDRVTKKARGNDKEAVECRELFARVRDALARGEQARALVLNDREQRLLRPLFLLTAKPVLFVANVGDDDVRGESRHARALLDLAAARQAEAMVLAGKLECDVAELPADEAKVFLTEYGLVEPVLDRLIRQAYHLLGLRTFFTAGSMEIKAWTFHQGDKAPRAAAVIHTDFEKKFIRANIHSVDDLEKHRTEAAIKAAGKLRVEGKDYEMQDGDVVHFLIGG